MRNTKAKNMARQKPSDHIETLKKQQAELAKKLKEAQTKARNEAKEFQRHKNELAGAVALKELEANRSGAFAISLLALLAKDLTRAGDRAAFDLPPLPKETKSEAAPPLPRLLRLLRLLPLRFLLSLRRIIWRQWARRKSQAAAEVEGEAVRANARAFFYGRGFHTPAPPWDIF